MVNTKAGYRMMRTCSHPLLAVAEQDSSADGRGRGRRARPERHRHGGDVVFRPPVHRLLDQGVAGEGKVLPRHLLDHICEEESVTSCRVSSVWLANSDADGCWLGCLSVYKTSG